jgi:hypothetical protein
MLAIFSIVLVAQGDQINFTATALERGIHCSPSLLLMLLFMLWSIPVLVYATLYFPELKQSVRSRRGVHVSRKDKSDDATSQFGYSGRHPSGKHHLTHLNPVRILPRKIQ